LSRPDDGHDAERDEDAEPAGVVPAVRKLQRGRCQRRDAAQVSDRQVDLGDQEDEDDTERDHRHARHLQDDVHEVPRREEVRGGEAEIGDDQDLADDDRQDAEVARLDVADRPLPEGPVFELVALGEPDARGDDVGSFGHATISGAVSAMPATLVGTPAVIAWTISCSVVFARS
jgi:hypothetical protein